MSKRPAFQFYTGDWRKNPKLRRCSPAARGVWIDILCLFHDSEEEYGMLRWPLKDVANAAGASMTLVRELVDKGVLKGADKDAPAYVYRPKHAGKEGEPVTLVIADGGPVWYSSRMVRDEYVRQRRGESTRFDAANQPDSRSPKGGIGGRQGDGPSTSSSPSGSEANASAGAGAPPPVDKSTEQPTARASALEWLAKHRVEAGDARAFLNAMAKDYGTAIAAQACIEAVKQDPIGDAKAFMAGIAKRLKTPPSATVPSAAAEHTAEYLAQQAAEREAAQAALAANGGKVPDHVRQAAQRAREAAALGPTRPATEGAEA